MITSPATLKSYFESIATDLGCSFVFGNSERILNRQQSGLQYPVLWLEIPEIRLFRNGTLQREFRSAFLCLTDRPADDFDGQDTALDEMHTLTEQVLQKMQADSEDIDPTPFLFDMANAFSEYKGKWSADDDWGWRTEFELIGAACESEDCCD
jgi:hypothetical protein